MTDRIGQRLGNYTLTRLLGQGGFAEVYLGEHLYLKSQAAIKILQTRLSTTDDTDSFLQEAQTIARLAHPNIIRVLDFGIEQETPYLVMDYAPNGTLRQRHPRGTQVPLLNAISYVKQIADALQYAHDERIIHRDIKPENMLLGRRNEVLLSDFGIALVAQSSRYQGTQDVIGTVAYMSPEQIQGKPRPGSDQYSLSVVVYEWLTGDRPFHGSFTEMCTQHMFAPPPPLTQRLAELSPSVEQVILRALNKDPHQRFATIHEFAEALEEASGTTQTERAIQPAQNNNSTILMPDGTTPWRAEQSPLAQTLSPTQNATQSPGQNYAQSTHLAQGSSNDQPGQRPTQLQGSDQSATPQLTNRAGQSAPNNAPATLHSSETSLQAGIEAASAQSPHIQQSSSPKLVLPAYTPQQRPASQPGIRQYPNDPRFQAQTPQQQFYPQQGNQPARPPQFQQSPYAGYNNAQQAGGPYNAQPPQQQSPIQRPYPEQQRTYEQPPRQDENRPNNTNSPYQTRPSSSAESAGSEPAEDWFGFLGAWKWRGLATLVGIVLFAFLFDFHITLQGHTYPFVLVIPLFFGGAFGLIAGLLVGLLGALLASMFYHTGVPFASIIGGGHIWLAAAFYGLAGLGTGLSIIGRRRLPSIGSSIRAVFLALIIVAIMTGYLAFTIYGVNRTDYFLRRLAFPLSMSLFVDIIIAFILLIVYSIIARLINPVD